MWIIHIKLMWFVWEGKLFFGEEKREYINDS